MVFSTLETVVTLTPVCRAPSRIVGGPTCFNAERFDPLVALPRPLRSDHVRVEARRSSA